MKAVLKRAFAPGAVTLLMLMLESAAWAATITVNDTEDEINSDGSCSLREAIQAANTDTAIDGCDAGAFANTVVVPAGTYTLSIPGSFDDDNLTGDFDILSDVTLTGESWQNTIIDAAGLDRPLHVHCAPDPNDSLGSCVGQTFVTVRGLTLQNGSTLSNHGGGLLASGQFGGSTSPITTVDSCRITGNQANLGGGLGNETAMSVSASHRPPRWGRAMLLWRTDHPGGYRPRRQRFAR